MTSSNNNNNGDGNQLRDLPFSGQTKHQKRNKNNKQTLLFKLTIEAVFINVRQLYARIHSQNSAHILSLHHLHKGWPKKSTCPSGNKWTD